MLTVDPTANAPFIQADHVSKGSNLPITRIVIHGTVSLTMLGGALQIAYYFTTPAAGGSAQYVVDPGEIVQCVAEGAIAWHAPPNPGSLGFEFCDMVDWDLAYPNGFPNEAAWHNRWSLPLWDAMLRLGAAGVRAMCLKYNVPMVRINSAQLLAGAHGICGHIDVSQAWHQTDHHDPGPDFPWGRFMSYVTNPPGQAAPVAVTPPTATTATPIEVIEMLPKIITALGADDKSTADDFPMLAVAGKFVPLGSTAALQLAQRYVAFCANPADTHLYQSEVNAIRALLSSAT